MKDRQGGHGQSLRSRRGRCRPSNGSSTCRQPEGYSGLRARHDGQPRDGRKGVSATGRGGLDSARVVTVRELRMRA